MLIFITFQSCNKNPPTTPVIDPPTIISFTPSSGNTNDQVLINGTNFSSTISNNIVSFNGTSATVISATSTQLSVTVPSGATTGKIYITVNGQTAVSASDFIKIATASPPIIVTFTPSGSIGDTIIITGTGFGTTSTNNVVTFNGVTATVIAATTTQLTVVVPAGITSGKIKVSVSGQSITSGTDFIKLATSSEEVTFP